MDTDAAGIWHYTAVYRHVESAEAELHRRLRIRHLTFGYTPRVRVAFDVVDSVLFGAVLTTTLWVEHVGRTSIRYVCEVATEAGVAARGSLVIVTVDTQGRSVPVPQMVREQLLNGGDVTMHAEEPPLTDRLASHRTSTNGSDRG